MTTREGDLKEFTYKKEGLAVGKRVFYTLTDEKRRTARSAL